MDDCLRVEDSRGGLLGWRIRRASTFWTRFRGLMGSRELREGEGLLLVPCNSIHMFFMRYPIDVAFLDAEGRVVGLVHRIRPWRVTRPYRGARMALELPAGVLERSGVALGERLRLLPAEPGACGDGRAEEG